MKTYFKKKLCLPSEKKVEVNSSLMNFDVEEESMETFNNLFV